MEVGNNDALLYSGNANQHQMQIIVVALIQNNV